MATMARAPRDILLDTDAEYQRLAEQHAKYEAEHHDYGETVTDAGLEVG